MRLRVRVANLLKDQPMSRSIIYLGMDVHKESITIAVLPENAAAPTRLTGSLTIACLTCQPPEKNHQRESYREHSERPTAAGVPVTGVAACVQVKPLRPCSYHGPRFPEPPKAEPDEGRAYTQWGSGL